MARPVITLTTDFGLSGHYAGTMKGVILRICPQAQIVDITHGVKPFQIAEGAYAIAQAYRFFPKRTVHVVVVDPGVGTARRPILMEAAGQFFVAPDNGVLAMVFAHEAHKVRLIANERYWLRPVSRTFHGRDIFSPVGAHLAAGVPAARMGKLIKDYLRPEFEKPLRTGEASWMGRILKIDRFGNMVTNFHSSDFPNLERGNFALTLGPRTIGVMARTYAECGPGELFVITGSGGYLEISLAQGSAAKQTGCKTGAPAGLSVW